MDTFHYAGFLSYAHSDEALAARLHKALEHFRIPKGLTRSGHKEALSPIFRDSEELSAHHSLPEKIASAVDSARFLIVLCTPASKASHWVNEEIRLFRARRGDPFIICALAEGTPETAFPPALTEGGREPLAATLTPESFNLGVSQIAAAMLGVGLDDLVQRAAKRKTRRLQFGMAASLALTAFMGGATYLAYDARNAAEDSRVQAEASQARAETNRGQAEDLVQFMVTDLRKELTAKERLSVLASIGERVTQYYDAQDTNSLPDSSLTRQAKAREVLGQVAIDMNDLDKAQKEVDAAARLSKQVLDNNPDSADAIFEYAQSVYWQGRLASKLGEADTARAAFTLYAELGQKLYDLDPKNLTWIMERGWGANNLAYLDRDAKNYSSAQARYAEAITFFTKARLIAPQSRDAEIELSNALSGAAYISLQMGEIEQSREYRQLQINLLSQIHVSRPSDLNVHFRLSQARMQAYLNAIHTDPQTCNINEIDERFDAFSSLLDYDSANSRWRSSGLMKWANMLTICSNYLPTAQILPRLVTYKVAVDEGETGDRLETYTAEIAVIGHILQGEEPLANKRLLDWENLKRPRSWDPQRRAFYYTVIGEKQTAQSILKVYQEPASLSPTTIRRKAQTLEIMGNCKAADALLKQREIENPAPRKPFNLCDE